MMNRLFIKSVFVFASLLLLQSCFVAKDYERPDDFEPDEELFRTDRVEIDSTSMSDFSWKEVFTDEVLQNHIEEALENNIDIRIAFQQIQIAESYAKEGKVGYLPELNFGGSVNYQQLAPNSQFGNFFTSITQYETAADLSWEADVWGKIRSNRRATQAQHLQSVAGHQLIKTELIAEIAQTYYSILSLDKQIKITEETIETRKKSLETSKALKDAGDLTQVAVNQTEAQIYAAQAILIDLKDELRRAENTLEILKANQPQKPARSSIDEIEIAVDAKIGVPVKLLRNRPDVIAAEQNFINAFEMTNVARASLYPSFNLTSAAGLQSLSFSDFISPNSFFFNMMGSFAQPIFNRRRLKTELEVTKATQKQAKLEFQQTLLTAGKEVSDALYSLEMFSDKIEVKKKEHQAYRSAFQSSEELLLNGLADYLEVLNAQENMLNTELDLVDNKRQLLQANIDLYKALGGGWK
ncbi:MAG: TolC family protein [Bacteroidota bacterium]